MSRWLSTTIVLAVSVISVCVLRKKWKDMQTKVQELDKSLKANLCKCAAERQGRIRAQQALREALLRPMPEILESVAYPMKSIGIVQSCFSTRNGTPRQPLLVPLARACVLFNPTMIPHASLEGLQDYSHCWIIYVFHLNTDLEKLWKEPSKSKFKAKVRVPRLMGERMGLFATRSPHRPNPIGLTVAKVEGVQKHKVLLSGVDLVDGTPILDVKPYLPYSDSIAGAAVPDWVEVNNSLAISSVSFSAGFSSALSDCWRFMEKRSLYSSPEEFQRLIKQVLSWDIRSAAQRNRPHKSPSVSADIQDADMQRVMGEEACEQDAPCDFTYQLILEGLDISYTIGTNGNVLVENVKLVPAIQNGIYDNEGTTCLLCWNNGNFAVVFVQLLPLSISHCLSTLVCEYHLGCFGWSVGLGLNRAHCHPVRSLILRPYLFVNLIFYFCFTPSSTRPIYVPSSRASSNEQK